MPVLRRLAETQPEKTKNLHDYLTVLSWADSCEEVREEALRLHLNEFKAPPYVLDALGACARKLRQPEVAESYYRMALAKKPSRMNSALGLALALSEQVNEPAKLTQAWELLKKQSALHPRSVAPLLAQAHVAESTNDWFKALSLSEKAYELDPQNPDAALGIIRAAARLGAHHAAYKLALQKPGLLNHAEMDKLKFDSTAQKIREGIIDWNQKDPGNRFGTLASAISGTETLVVKLRGNGALSPPQRRALIDRLDALCESYRMREALELHSLLQKRNIQLPAYVKKSLASAYLYQEQPNQALALYREYLETEPRDFNARMGVFYALAESEQLDEAQAWIDQLVQDTPERIEAYSESTIRENPDYQSVLGGRVMARIYADRLKEANKMARQSFEAAPYSVELEDALAAVENARGLYRQAEERWRRILINDPENNSAMASLASTLLEIQDYPEARRWVQEAMKLRPESKASRTALRDWETHKLRELAVEAGVGFSSGGNNPAGTNDLFMDATLYSQPLAENGRMFVKNYFGQGQYRQGTIDWNRTAVGYEYRMRDLKVSADLNEGSGGILGTSLKGMWQIDDHWSIKGLFDSVSNDFPLRGIFSRVTATRVLIEPEWQLDESRKLSSIVGYMHFSDGNERLMLSANWQERIWSGPRYRADLTGSIWSSFNSNPGANYFNPAEDFSPTLALRNDWLTWRNYDVSLRQRLTLTAGGYWQRHYDVGHILGVLYEHEWEVTPLLSLTYGFGRLLHPYDGSQTARNYGSLALNWRF